MSVANSNYYPTILYNLHSILDGLPKYDYVHNLLQIHVPYTVVITSY